MRVTSLFSLLAAVFPILSSATSPLVAHQVQTAAFAERKHLHVNEFPYVKGRAMEIGNFDLSETFEENKVLVQLGLGASQGAVSEELTLKATCMSCFTTGTAVVTTDGLEKNDDILGDIVDFIKNPDPTDLIVEALDLAVEVKLDNLGGHFEFDIAFGAAGTFTIPLFKPQSPVGLQSLDDKNKIGLLFSVELTLNVNAAVDVVTGFDLSFPEGASFILNSVTGELVSMNIGGAQVSALPVTFRKGAACITATLRIKFQAALALDIFGKGFDFSAGVFFDPLQHKACVTLDPVAICPLDFTQNTFAEIGAFANAVVDLGTANLDLGGPKAVTTFFTGTLPGTCLSTATSSAATSILATAASTTSSPPKITYNAELEASKASTTTSGGMVIPTSSSENRTMDATKPTKHYKAGNEISTIISTHISATNATSIIALPQHASKGSTSVMNSHSKKSAMNSTPPATVLSSEEEPAITAPAEMTTRTIWSTQNMTITSCHSAYIMCPSHLATPVIQTITQVQYTTVCPVSQASFPTVVNPALAPPSGLIAITITLPTTTHHSMIEITSLNYMTPLPTPIVKTLDAPQAIYTAPTVACNITCTPYEASPAHVLTTQIQAISGSRNTTSSNITLPAKTNTAPEPTTTVIDITMSLLSTIDAARLSVATGTPILPIQNGTVESPLIANEGTKRTFRSPSVMLVGAVVYFLFR